MSRYIVKYMNLEKSNDLHFGTERVQPYKLLHDGCNLFNIKYRIILLKLMGQLTMNHPI